MPVLARRALLVALGACGLAAVLGGIARLGFSIPVVARLEHGPLLVLGVFSGVIGLERAVALGRGWAYAAPALGVLGALAQLLDQRLAGAALALAAGAGLVCVNLAIVHKQSAPFTWLMLLGSGALLAGTAAWAWGAPVFRVVPAWVCFFVLTIAAERLELSRLSPRPRWATAVLAGLCVLATGAALAALWLPAPSVRIFGAALAGIALWQLRLDLARRTVRTRGLPRYAAIGVLLGALWLGVSGAALAALSLPPAGPVYDALLHGVFVGFVLSMVFAHAPIILPAVARVQLPFHPVLYVPLGLLHVALAARIAGDLLGVGWLRQAGGLGNAGAIVLFAASALLARRLVT